VNIIALDTGCPDDQPSFSTRNDVYAIARVHEPQHVAQFDIGGIKTHDLSANTAQLWPIPFCSYAAAIHHDPRIGQGTIHYECFPMAFDLAFHETQCHRL